MSTDAVERFSDFYVDTDDGYWLTCERCGRPLHRITAGDSLPDLLLAATLHDCAAVSTPDGTPTGE